MSAFHFHLTVNQSFIFIKIIQEIVSHEVEIIKIIDLTT
jgi:hypothetical protein